MLDQQRIGVVSKIAHTLWEDFLATYPSRYKPHSLFEPSQGKNVNPAIRDFFRFCAELTAPNDIQDEAESNVVVKDLRPITNPKPGKAASWLTRHSSSKTKHCVAIAIDLPRLNESLDYQSVSRARNHLTLHEIGHLFLHPELLHDGVEQFGATYAKSVSPVHEAEAWWFCYALLGRAVADVAFTNKEDPENADDQVWKIVLR